MLVGLIRVPSLNLCCKEKAMGLLTPLVSLFGFFGDGQLDEVRIE